MPDPMLMTHINYSFGHVNDSFDGVRIDNPDRLSAIVSLKSQNPSLKVMLSIGGWGSGRFSEMASDENLRASFCNDCLAVVDRFGLDGIDIDWEYPGSSSAGISSSVDDRENFTILMKELREVLGAETLLTFASNAGADYINYSDVLPYVDFVNVMAYDMALAPKHHSALYDSPISGSMTSDRAVKRHIEEGIPADRLVMGMPFYGKGPGGSFVDLCRIDFYGQEGVKECWDDEAMVPYFVNSEGDIILCHENLRSIGIKCDYINDNGLLGAMYWDYAGDLPDKSFSTLVYEKMMSR